MKAPLSRCFMFALVPIMGITFIAITSLAIAEDLSDSLYSKGGVIYPSTGDSTQEIYRTPPNITDYLKPGMFLGVLPEDCKSASHGTIGDYYVCNHELYLKPEEHNGRAAYLVIELD